jgi:hypothetical protein
VEKTPADDHLPGGVSVPGEQEVTASVIKPCSLEAYRRYVGQLPRPSDEQIEDWVQFVSDAHSWYKHLPLLPPGQPFHFFLDPFSGYDRILQPGGGVVHQERTDTSFRFHYTWMTTKDYRRRFGHLAYESGAGTYFVVQVGGVARQYGAVPFFYTADGPWHIPLEVAEAGLVELTSLIHPLATDISTWLMMLHLEKERPAEGAPRKWPSETGGEETFRQIKEALDAAVACYERDNETYETFASLLQRDPASLDTLRMYWGLVQEDYPLHGGWDQMPLREGDGETRQQIEELVAQARKSRRRLSEIEEDLGCLTRPEKQRLQRNMTEAIHRMLALVYDRE